MIYGVWKQKATENIFVEERRCNRWLDYSQWGVS